MPDAHELSSMIKEISSDLGFELCGISESKLLSSHEIRLRDWIAKGQHADMEYMARNLDKRLDPSLLVDGARSVITVAINYYQEKSTLNDSPDFSIYAYGEDYHKIVKDKLYTLMEEIKKHRSDVVGRVFVDSAPVLERAWAVESGLGWIGKNSMLINRKSGSFIFLGTIITNLDLEYDKPESDDYCGSCSLCIDSCPTRAITEYRSINSERCLSYLTIEKRGGFEEGDPIKLHNTVFGCDICQDVCPWNRKLRETQEEGFTISPEIAEKSTEDWKRITEDEFNFIFRNSPVLRTGYSGFIRNLKAL